jgi:cysteine synthase A
MKTVTRDVLAGIGNTPLVELQKVVPAGAARVVLKLEGANPTGSMKDRMARSAIEAAETDGRLKRGMTVVEYTGGSTGVSLALVCAAKGYAIEIVSSDAFSQEKLQSMRAFGARLTVVPSEGGKMTADLFKRMIATASEISARPNHWWFDQLNNRDGVAGYFGLGDELWSQAEGRVDGFVQTVGTSHSLEGISTALKKHRPDLHVVAVEPAESAVLAGRPPGAHQIEGIGIGFKPPLWRPELATELDSVSTADAKAMARRLAREEGVFTGTSSGANVVAAIRLAQKLGEGATVATLAIDTGLRYLSTDLYRSVEEKP